MVGTLQTSIHIVGTGHYVDGFCWFPCVVLAHRLLSFLGHGWIVLKVIKSREGTSFLLCMQLSLTINVCSCYLHLWHSLFKKSFDYVENKTDVRC